MVNSHKWLAAVARDKRITDMQARVCTLLWDFTDRASGTLVRSQLTLAGEAGRSERFIRQLLSLLVALGYLSARGTVAIPGGKGKWVRRYALTVPQSDRHEDMPVPTDRHEDVPVPQSATGTETVADRQMVPDRPAHLRSDIPTHSINVSHSGAAAAIRSGAAAPARYNGGDAMRQDPNEVDTPTAGQLRALHRWLREPDHVLRWPDAYERTIHVPMQMRWRGYHVIAEEMCSTPFKEDSPWQPMKSAG